MKIVEIKNETQDISIVVTYPCYVHVFRKFRIDHHEIFSARHQAVNIVIGVKMDDRSRSPRAHPQIEFV